MSLTILVLVSILGVTFATTMRLSERTSRDFLYETQARYVAEAAMQYAIAALKDDARSNFVFNGLSLSQPAGVAAELLDGEGTFQLTVKDAGGRININEASEELLATTLDGVGATKAKAIIDERSKIGSFKTPSSICLATGVGGDTYQDNAELITLSSYKDPNVQDDAGQTTGIERCAVNINTVLANNGGDDLVEGLLAAIDGINTAEADVVRTALSNALAAGDQQFDSWAEFDEEIDKLTSFSAADRQAIKDNCNPNRMKPTWDSTAASTELCFHSGGTYEVTVTGNVQRNNQVVASKEITALVKIFDLWNITSKEEFENAGGAAYPDHDRITWFDSCPLNVNQCYSAYSYDSTSAETISDALKMGYWDDFSEDVTYSQSLWKVINGPNFSISGGTLSASGQNWPVAGLGIWNDPEKKWRWQYHSVRAQLSDLNPDVYYNPSAPHDDRVHYDPSPLTDAYTRKHYDIGSHLFLRSVGISGGSGAQYDIFIGRQDPNDAYHLANGWDSSPPHDGYWPAKNRLYITLNSYYRNIEDATGSDDYYADKMFQAVVTRADSVNDTCAVTAYFPDNNSITYSVTASANWNGVGIGQTHVYACKSGFTLDNLRIIGGMLDIHPNQHPTASDYPYYRSESYSLTELVEWANVSGTVTMPGTADGNSEKVTLQASVDSGSWVEIGSNPDRIIGGTVTDSGDSLHQLGNSIQWHADFKTSDTDFSETAVLEDVWVSYMKPAEILYWRE